MTKEELLEALNVQLGSTSNLSERTISDYAEQMASAMGEEFKLSDEFVGKQVAVLKSLGGQLSHDISKGIEDWKTKNVPAQKPSPSQRAGEEGTNGGGNAKQLEEKLNSLITQIEKRESETRMREYRNQLMSQLKEKIGEGANKYILNDVVNSKDWDTAKPVADIIGEAEKTYSRKYKECFGNGPSPRNNQGNGKVDEKAMNARREALKQKLRSTGKLPSVKKED